MSRFLTCPPFNLDPDALAWVTETHAALTLPQKVAQLFNLMSMGKDPGEAARLAALQPGGITRFFTPDADHELTLLEDVRAGALIPPLISADLEGSRMSLPFGTEVPNPLALAAIDDVEASRSIARIMAEEAVALGVNWSFTPVLDINAAFRSPIVATRSFGSDPARIARHALAQAEVFQRHGIAATVKHFPGEGHDDRDQHLVTTIMPLSVADWEATHGALYRAAIAAGVLCVMSAHIAFPAFVRSLGPDAGPDAGIEAFRPASVSHRLNIDLLRNRLGFNGLIVSDASEMAGLTAWVKAEDSKPLIIANGCDMILFSHDPESDMAAVLAAARSGAIPAARIDDAVLRVLGLKAALGLHRAPAPAPARTKADRRQAIGTAQNRSLARSVTARAPTLVKDSKGLLPISLARHRRIRILSTGIISPPHRDPIAFALPDMLAAEGFEVTLGPDAPITPGTTDLLLYLFGEETLLTRGRIFLDWARLGSNFVAAMQRHWHHVPTALVSFGYPYYLYDAPRAPACINAYATMQTMQEAVLECLLGRAPFNTTSPVDAFCGLEDARY